MNYISSLIKVLNHQLNQGRSIQTITRIMWWKLNQFWLKWPVVVEILPQIDVEGAELMVLNGLQKYLEENKVEK